MPYVRNSYLQKNSVCNRVRIAASGPQIPFLVGNDDELHKYVCGLSTNNAPG